MRYTKQIQPLRTGNRTSAVYHLQEGTQEHPLQVKVDWIAAGNGDTVTGVIEGRMYDTDEWVDLVVFTEGDFGAVAGTYSAFKNFDRMNQIRFDVVNSNGSSASRCIVSTTRITKDE